MGYHRYLAKIRTQKGAHDMLICMMKCVCMCAMKHTHTLCIVHVRVFTDLHKNFFLVVYNYLMSFRMHFLAQAAGIIVGRRSGG